MEDLNEVAFYAFLSFIITISLFLARKISLQTRFRITHWMDIFKLIGESKGISILCTIIILIIYHNVYEDLNVIYGHFVACLLVSLYTMFEKRKHYDNEAMEKRNK